MGVTLREDAPRRGKYLSGKATITVESQWGHLRPHASNFPKTGQETDVLMHTGTQ